MAATTSKAKLAEQIQRLISAGNISADASFDPREIMLLVEQAFAYVLRARYFQSKQEDGANDINGDLVFPLPKVKVERDKDTGRYYSEIPAQTIDLPNGIGIKSISRSKEIDGAFVPLQPNFPTLYAGLEASSLSGRIGFYVEGQRVYYKNMTHTNKPETVFVRAVLPLGSLDEDTEFNMPSDIQLMVIEQVRNMLITKPREDDVNDGVSIPN